MPQTQTGFRIVGGDSCLDVLRKLFPQAIGSPSFVSAGFAEGVQPSQHLLRTIDRPKINARFNVSPDWLLLLKIEQLRNILWLASEISCRAFSVATVAKEFSGFTNGVCVDVFHRATSPSSLATAA
jgi:hypothetical protein